MNFGIKLNLIANFMKAYRAACIHKDEIDKFNMKFIVFCNFYSEGHFAQLDSEKSFIVK